eukprot:scaffold9191_cov114-Cylindrotheca_fusiformis.AAC.5
MLLTCSGGANFVSWFQGNAARVIDVTLLVFLGCCESKYGRKKFFRIAYATSIEEYSSRPSRAGRQCKRVDKNEPRKYQLYFLVSGQ